MFFYSDIKKKGTKKKTNLGNRKFFMKIQARILKLNKNLVKKNDKKASTFWEIVSTDFVFPSLVLALTLFGGIFTTEKREIFGLRGRLCFFFVSVFIFVVFLSEAQNEHLEPLISLEP